MVLVEYHLNLGELKLALIGDFETTLDAYFFALGEFDL